MYKYQKKKTMKTHLTETFLSSPHTSMNNFQKQLSGSRIENEDRTIDWFGSEITFESLKSS